YSRIVIPMYGGAHSPHGALIPSRWARSKWPVRPPRTPSRTSPARQSYPPRTPVKDSRISQTRLRGCGAQIGEEPRAKRLGERLRAVRRWKRRSVGQASAHSSNVRVVIVVRTRVCAQTRRSSIGATYPLQGSMSPLPTEEPVVRFVVRRVALAGCRFQTPSVEDREPSAA